MENFPKSSPKMSIARAAEVLGISVHGVHKRLRTKGFVCPRMGNKSYITNDIARQLFNIPFKKLKIAGQIVKGGTGKTTAIHNIACCATTYGARILAIDLDPQGNLTDANDIDPEEMPVLIDFINGDANIEDGIVNVSDGYDLIPSRIENVVLDNTVTNKRLPLATIFSNLLAPLEANYDFIFIDCPPIISQMVTAANLYADVILVPLNPDKFSAKGLKILKQEITLLQKHYKKDIEYKVFLNKFSGNTILSDKAIASIFADPDMEGRALQTAVRYTQEIPNTTDSSKNLFSNLKKSTARDDFELLTTELLGIEMSMQATRKSSAVDDREKVSM